MDTEKFTTILNTVIAMASNKMIVKIVFKMLYFCSGRSSETERLIK